MDPHTPGQIRELYEPAGFLSRLSVIPWAPARLGEECERERHGRTGRVIEWYRFPVVIDTAELGEYLVTVDQDRELCILRYDGRHPLNGMGTVHLEYFPIERREEADWVYGLKGKLTDEEVGILASLHKCGRRDPWDGIVFPGLDVGDV